MRAGWALGLALLLADARPPEEPRPDSGAATRWRIEPEQSDAQFRVRLFGLIPLPGRIERLRGHVDVDLEAGDARVVAELEARRVTMDDPDHAAWARSPEFFDAAEHPVIRFESDVFSLKLLADGGPLRGRLTLRGRTRRVSFTVEPGCDARRAQQCVLGVGGHIRRTDFGMRARRGTVGDRVQLALRIAARAER